MKKYIKIAPLALFCLLAIKCLFVSATFPDAIILVALAAMSSFFEYKIQDSRDVKIRAEIKALADQFVEIQKIQESIKSNVSSMKLSQGFRPQGQTNGSR